MGNPKYSSGLDGIEVAGGTLPAMAGHVMLGDKSVRRGKQVLVTLSDRPSDLLPFGERKEPFNIFVVAFNGRELVVVRHG